MVHINLHIIYIDFFKMNLHLEDLQESIKSIKSYQENKIEFLDEFSIQIEIPFEFEYSIRFL